ncbi:MotA/TolQ/ExbB proton channel family protein, partial [Novosphingobium sp. 1949]
MNPHNLFDETSALIVVGGTLLATLLRCGFADSGAALVALRGLLRRRFRGAHLKAELAVHVQEMRQDGVIRTQPHLSGDAEIDAATDALIGSRSVAGLHIAHIAHKRRRAEQAMRAVRTLSQAADLSPVLGLAGTLVSLSQLPAGGGAASGGGSFTAAISMAVLTTLYGLLLGNMVFAPLARMVARRAAEEEKERQAVLDWLEQQVAVALPSQAASLPAAPGKATGA